MEAKKIVPVIKLDKPVVTRRIPMTSRGCDLLRKCRELQVEEYCKKNNVDVVDIPFPTAFHIILEEYAHLKGIKV